MKRRLLLKKAQRGIALPVTLIILAVMLISSIYLLKSSTSTTLTTSNLAYDAALSKASELGMQTAFAWLSGMATSKDKAVLTADVPAQGYVATLNPTLTVSSAAFWTGKAVITDSNNNRIEYVIHRMCTFAGLYNQVVPTVNSCMLTSARQAVAAPVALGTSLASDAQALNGLPQLHYVITARIFGARGGNVVTQSVVMMGP